MRDSLLAKDYQVAVDFRNQITHEYFGIDLDVVWTIIHTDLDQFEHIILELIQEMEANLKNELIEAFIEDNNYLDFVVKKLEVLRGSEC